MTYPDYIHSSTDLPREKNTIRMGHNSLKVALLLLFGGFVMYSLEAASVSCSPPKLSVMQVLLNTQRNRTGHWITQVDLQQTDRRDSSLRAKNTERFSVDVQHIQTSSSSSCVSAPAMIIRTTITVPPLPPGPDYELIPDIGYYKIHTDVAVWSRAREICAEEGTHLVVINSQQEADVMKELLARFPKFENATGSEYAYVGFHDLINEGKFVTIFGDPLTKAGYLQWHGAEPNLNPVNEEDCGLVHRDGKLADVVCHWLQPFVCEQEL